MKSGLPLVWLLAAQGVIYLEIYIGGCLRDLWNRTHPNTKIWRKLGPIQIPNVKKIMTHVTLYKYKKYTECKMYPQWGISLSAYHTNRLKQEIQCWKYKLVYHLDKVRTHWHTKTAKIRTHWHTKKAEKDTHSSSTSLAFICSKLPPGTGSVSGTKVSGPGSGILCWFPHPINSLLFLNPYVLLYWTWQGGCCPFIWHSRFCWNSLSTA